MITMQTVTARNAFAGKAVMASRPTGRQSARKAVAIQASAATAFNTKKSEEVRIRLMKMGSVLVRCLVCSDQAALEWQRDKGDGVWNTLDFWDDI